MIVVLRMFRVTSESQDHGTFSHMKWDNEAVCRFDGDDGSTYTFQKSTMNVDGDKLQVTVEGRPWLGGAGYRKASGPL